MFFEFYVFPLRVLFIAYFPTLALHVQITLPAHIHVHLCTQSYTQYRLFSSVFLLWSNCGCVLCWSNSQTTVATLFVPSLLCDRYEGSPLCDQKTFFVVAQPLRTGLCQSPDLRGTQQTGKTKLSFLPSSFVWCSASVWQQSDAVCVLISPAF